MLSRLALLFVLVITAFTVSCSAVPSPRGSPAAPAKPTQDQTATAISAEPTATASSPLPSAAPRLSPTVASEPPITLAPRPTVDLINADPAQVDNSNLPITPTEYLGVTGTPPDIDVAKYVLSVDGLVKVPLALSYQAVLQRPAVTETLLLICPGFFADNAEWTGVLVSTLLAEAGLKPGATQAVFHALDGYTQTFDLLDLARDGVFLAYTVNGQTLPKEHGYPVRLVVKGKYGSFWVKWVDRIDIK